MAKVKLARMSREMVDIVNYIKAQHLLKGKKVPSTSTITKKMVSKIKKEELLHNEFIRF